MTALAMIIGMLPMSLGLGEGGEQNAPLGRAVIGGLLLATADDALLRAGDVQPPATQAAGPRRSACWRPYDPAPGRPAARPDARPGHGHDLGFDLPPPRDPLEDGRRSRRVLGAALLLGSAFAFGYLPAPPRAGRARRSDAQRRAVGDARRGHRPEGGVERPRRAPLPGSVQPLKETVLYARASGFVRRWLVDIGDKVTAGQLLAEIETPELDQELEQARAQLAQAQPTLQRSRASRDLRERQPAALPAAHAGRASRRRPTSIRGRRRRRSTTRTSASPRPRSPRSRRTSAA